MDPYEVWDAKVLWGGCEDRRPWLIVDHRDGENFGCFPISSQCYDGGCFYLDQLHPDFPATGLTKSCYIHDERLIVLHAEDLLRLRGQLTGDLLRDFLDYAGL